MFKIKSLFVIAIIALPILSSCQSVTKKIDEKTKNETIELSKWLNKTESDLKIAFGQPDKVQFLDTQNRNYIYITQKFKIKCQRTFEINRKNIVVGFRSENCF